MFDNFSEAEIEYLKDIKLNLWENPGEYFFHQYKSIDDFEKINTSMWLGLWQYLNSSFLLMLKTFNILSEVSYSLLTLNFSNAASLVQNASKDCLDSLTKFSLAVGHLCLNLCRSLTLFVATFFPQLTLASLTIGWAYISLMCLMNPSYGVALLVLATVATSLSFGLLVESILSPLIKSSAHKPGQLTKKESEKKQDVEFFLKFCEKMYEEKKQIRELLRAFLDNLKLTKKELNQEQRFFSARAEELLVERKREFNEDLEFGDDLCDLLSSYPDYSFDLATRDRDYANIVYKELSEHHAKIIPMVELLGQKMDKRPENNNPEYKQLISM